MIEKSEINVVPLPTEEVTAQIQKKLAEINELLEYLKS